MEGHDDEKDGRRRRLCRTSRTLRYGFRNGVTMHLRVRERDLLVAGCSGLSVVDIKPLCVAVDTVPECWHGDVCAWHKRGRCLFKHCAPPPVGLTGG